MISLRKLLFESYTDTFKEWYHGSPTGELGGGEYGLHLGTYIAAKEALENNIGTPVDGEWDGTREYGKTLLCGKNTLHKRNIFPFGFNVDIPEEDFFQSQPLKYAPNIKLTMHPNIKKYILHCKMLNTISTPYSDSSANQYMKNFSKKNINFGIFYKNVVEDTGSISVVVSNKNCVKEI